MRKLRRTPENIFTVGSRVKNNALEGWLLEAVRSQ
jgi:hypothetical protein